jgi:hypothetical protein
MHQRSGYEWPKDVEVGSHCCFFTTKPACMHVHTPLVVFGVTYYLDLRNEQLDWFLSPGQCPLPGKFLGIVGQDPSDSKSNRLHVDILQFCFIHLSMLCIFFSNDRYFS